MYLVKYHYIHDNSNVYYTCKYRLVRNCKQNIKLLHCTENNFKIHAPYEMYDNYSQNTCSRVCERVMEMVVVVMVMVVECDVKMLSKPGTSTFFGACARSPAFIF